MKETLAEIDKEIEAVKKELADVRGTETEVYARIVGYYRAVKNWNRGKAEEYTHRKNFTIQDEAGFDIPSYAEEADALETTFSPEREMLMEDEALSEECPPQEKPRKGAAQNGGLHYELFARKTCPNCPPVKEWIANSGLDGRTIDVDTESGLKEAAQKGVFAAPTVIFYKADGSESERAHSVSELEEIFASQVA